MLLELPRAFDAQTPARGDASSAVLLCASCQIFGTLVDHRGRCSPVDEALDHKRFCDLHELGGRWSASAFAPGADVQMGRDAGEQDDHDDAIDLHGYELIAERCPGGGAGADDTEQTFVFAKGDFDIPATQVGVDDLLRLPAVSAQVGEQQHALRDPVAARPAWLRLVGEHGAHADNAPASIVLAQAQIDLGVVAIAPRVRRQLLPGALATAHAHGAHGAHGKRPCSPPADIQGIVKYKPTSCSFWRRSSSRRWGFGLYETFSDPRTPKITPEIVTFHWNVSVMNYCALRRTLHLEIFVPPGLEKNPGAPGEGAGIEFVQNSLLVPTRGLEPLTPTMSR